MRLSLLRMLSDSFRFSDNEIFHACYASTVGLVDVCLAMTYLFDEVLKNEILRLIWRCKSILLVNSSMTLPFKQLVCHRGMWLVSTCFKISWLLIQSNQFSLPFFLRFVLFTPYILYLLVLCSFCVKPFPALIHTLCIGQFTLHPPLVFWGRLISNRHVREFKSQRCQSL